MNLGQNRIGMRILRLARSPAFRIPKAFVIEFITASRGRAARGQVAAQFRPEAETGRGIRIREIL